MTGDAAIGPPTGPPPAAVGPQPEVKYAAAGKEAPSPAIPLALDPARELQELTSRRIQLENCGDKALVRDIHQFALRELAISEANIERLRPVEDKAQIKEWDKIRIQAFQLRSQAAERQKLLQARERLYKSQELPVEQNLPHILSDITNHFPHLEEGCAHFQHMLACLMRVKNDRITQKDAAKLRAFRIELEGFIKDDAIESFAKSVDKLIHTLEKAKQDKITLLHQLAQWGASKHVDFERWDAKDKIEFLVKAEQIIDNPFEPRLDPEEIFHEIESEKEVAAGDLHLKNIVMLIKSIQAESTVSPEKLEFWDFMPEFERRAHFLASTLELRAHLNKCKMEGLQAYIALQPKDAEADRYLVVGAGPAGLMQALCLTLRGKNFDIIEKRSEKKDPRQQIVTLGKSAAKDIEILRYTGALSRLNEKISYGHARPHYIETTLGDLESALKETLTSISGGPLPIRYNTEVARIDRDGEGAAVILKMSRTEKEKEAKSVEPPTIRPKAVIVADGFNGQTKALLGISRIELAKPTFIAFSFFTELIENMAPREVLKHHFFTVIQGIWLGLKILWCMIWCRLSFDKAAVKVVPAGPSGILRVPGREYFGQLYREEDQRIVAKFQSQISEIGTKLKLAKELIPKDTDHNHLKQLISRIRVLTENEEKLRKAMDSHIAERAREMHGVIDFAQSIYNPRGHKMIPFPMRHVSTHSVDVIVSKAEKSMVKVGKTPFFIRGDASHSTDPYTGTGCKTALEETLADQYFLRHSDVEPDDVFESAILDWGQDQYQQKMIDAAFVERFEYYTGTEREDRYADLAVRNGFMTRREANDYLRIIEKMRAQVVITREESLFLEEITKRIHAALDELYDPIRSRDWYKDQINRRIGEYSITPAGEVTPEMIAQSELQLSSDDIELLFDAMYNATQEEEGLSAESAAALRPIMAKLSCLGFEEGWLLKLLEMRLSSVA